MITIFFDKFSFSTLKSFGSVGSASKNKTFIFFTVCVINTLEVFVPTLQHISQINRGQKKMKRKANLDQV